MKKKVHRRLPPPLSKYEKSFFPLLLFFCQRQNIFNEKKEKGIQFCRRKAKKSFGWHFFRVLQSILTTITSIAEAINTIKYVC